MALPVEIPWREIATAVRIPAIGGGTSGEATILFEGPLEMVAQKLSEWPKKDLTAVRISLPDRTAKPHTFEGQTLSDLIGMAVRREH